jgi:hypothetical protein
MKAIKARMTAAQAAANARAALTLIGVGLVIVVAVSSFSYLVFVAAALMPTIGAAIMERRGQRQMTISVGALTLATVIPLVIGAIATGSHRNLLGSSAAWTFVGLAAAAGFAIYFLMPVANVWIDDMRAQARLKALRERQQQLEKDWGPEVAGRPAAAT